MPLIPLDSTVDFEYTGDENYPAKSKKTSIANVTAIIKATDMTRGYDSGVDYQVTVVDGNGNPMAKKQVTFIINGNKYNATTDDKGIAVLNIKLAIGTYAVTTVNPLNNDNITKTVKITISPKQLKSLPESLETKTLTHTMPKTMHTRFKSSEMTANLPDQTLQSK